MAGATPGDGAGQETLYKPCLALCKVRGFGLLLRAQHITGGHDLMAVTTPVIDTDTHITEPRDTWTARMSKKKWGDMIPHVEYDADMDLHDDQWVAREVPVGADASQLFLFQHRAKWFPSGPPPAGRVAVDH